MNHVKKILAVLLTLALVITLLPMMQINANAKTKTKLNKKKVTVYVGKNVKLKVKNKPAKKKVKWKSTNKKVATVTKKGKVKAKKAGKTTIIAKIGKKKYKCKVTVKKKTVETTKVVEPTSVKEQTTTASQTKPSETSVADIKPVETKPSETTPLETKPDEITKPAPTQPQETTKAPVEFITDTSIEKPFGMMVESPENGMVRVVWGRGNIDCYNVYVDGELRRTGVKAASYTLPVYFEGTHKVAIATVVGNKESQKVEMEIKVEGIGEPETEPETCPEELKPQLNSDLPIKEDKVLVQLNNKTGGKYADNEIYWCLIGYNKNKQLCYVDANGNMVPASENLNTLTINNRKVANVCNTLAESNHLYATTIESGRLYLSYGKPIYIGFVNAADGRVGYTGVDLNNNTDPNLDTLFEFAEFTIEGKNYWGNTTRVDFFSFPMVTRLIGHTQYETYDKTVGDIGTRDEIFSNFKKNAPEAFKTIVNDKRIIAPCKATFNAGQPYANYFDNYINEFWNKYAKEDLVFNCEGGTFTGRVEGNRMRFTKSGDSTAYYVDKPTTQEVLEGKGAFDRGNSTEKVIEAQLCAAFNRGVALEPSKYNKVSEYYKGSIYNYYAGFFHQNSILGLAYGFCYDDVNDQSTLLQYEHADALIIDLKW